MDITVCKCNYCGKQAVIVDDFGQCPGGCPGNFSNCKDFKNVMLSDQTMKEISEHYIKHIKEKE